MQSTETSTQSDDKYEHKCVIICAWLWNIFFNIYCHKDFVSFQSMSAPAGLMVFPPTVISTAVLTRIPMVSFSGFSSSSLATKGRKTSQGKIRNIKQQHITRRGVEKYNPRLRASLSPVR